MSHNYVLVCAACSVVLDAGCACHPDKPKARDPLDGYCEPCIEALDLRGLGPPDFRAKFARTIATLTGE